LIPYNDFYHLHYPLNYEDGYIKHYYTKSYIEFINKISRGWPDAGTKNNAITRTKGFFYYDDHNFLLNDYVGTTAISIMESYKNETEEFSKYLSSDTLYILDYSPYRNMNLTIYTIMNIIKAAGIHSNVVFALPRLTFVDNFIYNTLLELALENNNKIVLISSDEKLMSFECENIISKYNIKQIKNLSI